MICEELERILLETPDLIRAYLVGGCVRDWLLGIAHQDFDVEVFGLTYEKLAKALAPWGRVDLVGRSFGVVKLTTGKGRTYDFSIPRRDSKTAPGHKGFQVSFDESLTPREAAARRDFTINSLMFDPREKRILDFFGGETDLKHRILRHTSDAFPEDPLRVLRGMQFAGRFSLQSAPETRDLARSIKGAYPELAKERVREEWFKWAEKSLTPSLGLRFLAETEWIEHFPELNAIRGVPQDPEWHPEGDVFTHTCHCCDALVALQDWQRADPVSRIVYMLAVLTHDFGKATTTRKTLKRDVWRIVSPGHEDASGDLADSFLVKIDAPRSVRERVRPLAVNHMAHFQTVSDRAIRRLAKRLEPENIHGLLTVMTADAHGRPPRPPAVPEAVRAIAEKAEELEIRREAPRPILMGRILLELGFQPGIEMGDLLKKAYEQQLEGAFRDLAGALNWIAYKSHLPISGTLRARIEARVRELTGAGEA